MKALHNRNSHVGHSTLIHGWPKLDISDLVHSNIDLFMYLNENFNMVHENFTMVNENFNIWTGPKIKTICKVLKIVAKSMLFTLTRLSDKESSS